MKYSCKEICKCFVLGMMGHVGSLVLICLYLVGGGFLFIVLELDNEKQSCMASFSLLTQKLNDTTMRGIAIATAGLNTTMFYQQMYQMLFNFSKDVYTLAVSPTKNCTTLGEPDNLPNWNLANSIFFCATIVTTIGYGNIAPQTGWGRGVCIIYGLIGIPLMLVFLGNFGNLLASSFRSLYLNLCCCQCFVKKQPTNNIHTSSSTLGQLDTDEFHMMENKTTMVHGPPAKVIIENIDVEASEDDRSEYINIPLTVVLCFLTIYMFIGAALFRIWETWDLMSAVYFSFITISTIGFGDMYPAKDVAATSAGTGELLVAAIYCVIGLAILSMCLSLIKDELIGKFVWFATQMGIINQVDYSSDECDNDADIYVGNQEKEMIDHNHTKASIFENEAYDNSNYSEDVSINMKIKSA